MPARVVLVHDDAAFRDELAAALRHAGCEVVAINDPSFEVGPPRRSDHLEITVSRSTGAYPGLRMRVTGFRTSGPYAGPLGLFIAEPARIADVLRALRLFSGV